MPEQQGLADVLVFFHLVGHLIVNKYDGRLRVEGSRLLQQFGHRRIIAREVSISSATPIMLACLDLSRVETLNVDVYIPFPARAVNTILHKFGPQ